jgi:hypothetical protein
MSRARDMFLASVHMLKGRPKLLQELVNEVGRQKKTGDLTAEECDVILREVARCKARVFAEKLDVDFL